MIIELHLGYNEIAALHLIGRKMRITTLIENHENPSDPTLRAEHGLSFFIENQGHQVMSDVGQSVKFAENAQRLAINLTSVEALAISHHHYDHGGGLPWFFEQNTTGIVYLKETPAGMSFVAGSFPEKHIGLDKSVVDAYSKRVRFISRNQEVLPGFHLLTNIPRNHPKPGGDSRLKMKIGGETQPDNFAHELVTVLEQDNGVVILTGCAHNGVLNMIDATQKAFPGKSVLAVVGGFHLHREKEETIREIGQGLLEREIPAVYTGHCTGEDATDVLENILEGRLHRLYTGLEMVF